MYGVWTQQIRNTMLLRKLDVHVPVGEAAEGELQSELCLSNKRRMLT